jgi:hypothetical protein
MKYTEKMHAKRLLGMLNKKDPCVCCPRCHYYKWDGQWMFDQHMKYEHWCATCMEFVGMMSVTEGFCPCTFLGKKEAIKRTWIALEEKGYV